MGECKHRELVRGGAGNEGGMAASSPHRAPRAGPPSHMVRHGGTASSPLQETGMSKVGICHWHLVSVTLTRFS